MWTTMLSRCTFPAVLKRSSSVLACQAIRAASRPLQAIATKTSCSTLKQVRGQQTQAAPFPTTQVVRQVKTLEEERLVEIEWEDGGQSFYPFTWLRDNCQCPLCTLQSAQARSLLLSKLDIHTGVDSVQVSDTNKVCIVWPDQHTSEFDPEWLKKRCFSLAVRQVMQEELFLNERVYWDSKLQIPTANFEEVLHDDKAALAWLIALRRVGIVYMKGAPVKQGQVARLSERIGYLRLTFYGHTWQVKDKPMANNVAYTSGKLSLHTDYPALHNPPGVQFLHCLNQACKGGESEVVDGFHMAELLRREDPEAFSTLTSHRVDFTDTGADYCDFKVQSKNRIIDVDNEERVVRINYNNATRDSVLDVPLHQVQPFYRALKAYVELMIRPENLVTYMMEPGDLVTFDNWRLLHGRRSYISHTDALRHLEGAYLDWDEVMSRLRILRKSVHGNH
ncbi:gamma-butyrobetaine dioxygenase [Hypomesus transpacificus]|uniref:gamma-butyrobetaine dioxygenase n=1 Tax=Hypomesus transpacificus TaxID=137520 RepID=UPI001F083D76|nr:gamma-butyrobetaine dioxygenase [Hypomesus transpacificus]XP_046898684.1 gamma-butyrobetaine dioxygenase [Hypomesus transpacificus]